MTRIGGCVCGGSRCPFCSPSVPFQPFESTPMPVGVCEPVLIKQSDGETTRELERLRQNLALLVWTVQQHRKHKGENVAPEDEWLYSALAVIGSEPPEDRDTKPDNPGK